MLAIRRQAAKAQKKVQKARADVAFVVPNSPAAAYCQAGHDVLVAVSSSEAEAVTDRAVNLGVLGAELAGDIEEEGPGVLRQRNGDAGTHFHAEETHFRALDGADVANAREGVAGAHIALAGILYTVHPRRKFMVG